MDLEELWYETSPFIYALLGLAVLLNTDGFLAKASGALLLVASATVLRLRWKARIGNEQSLSVSKTARRSAQTTDGSEPDDSDPAKR